MNDEGKETEQFYFDKDARLEALRHLTRLTPMEKMKVKNARKRAEKVSELFGDFNYGDNLTVDYSVANSLEYAYRFNALKRILEKDYKKYIYSEKGGSTLDECAKEVIERYINKNNETNDRKK